MKAGAVQRTLEWGCQRDTAEKIVRATLGTIGFSNDVALKQTGPRPTK